MDEQRVYNFLLQETQRGYLIWQDDTENTHKDIYTDIQAYCTYFSVKSVDFIVQVCRGYKRYKICDEIWKGHNVQVISIWAEGYKIQEISSLALYDLEMEILLSIERNLRLSILTHTRQKELQLLLSNYIGK